MLSPSQNSNIGLYFLFRTKWSKGIWTSGETLSWLPTTVDPRLSYKDRSILDVLFPTSFNTEKRRGFYTPPVGVVVLDSNPSEISWMPDQYLEWRNVRDLN